MSGRQRIARAQRWVVKIGSALITGEGRPLAAEEGRGGRLTGDGRAQLTEQGVRLHHERLQDWAGQVASLRRQGRELILVSSGAVAEGVIRLGWQQRPKALHELQAAAAVGQAGLAHYWETALGNCGCRSAQVLLSRGDIEARRRYLNARAALLALLSLGVTPVVNENDTVATEEIRLGDNDTLAGHIASLVDADLLVILTDQPGLCERDPRQDPGAPLIPEAQVDDPVLDRAAGEGAGHLGRGGMRTKIGAARLAARTLADTVIADGLERDLLLRLAEGEVLGTCIYARDAEAADADSASERKMDSRKRWLAGLEAAGRVCIDDGAVAALRRGGASLLAVGVCEVSAEERFGRGDVINCCDRSGAVVAKGLVNYDASDLRQIQGLPSAEIEQCLGYRYEEELIHRDNLAVL